MRTIFPHLPRQPGQCVVDITPVPWWQRTARTLLALVIFVVAVPLLWLAGTLLAVLFTVSAVAVIVLAMFRPNQRPGAPR